MHCIQSSVIILCLIIPLGCASDQSTEQQPRSATETKESKDTVQQKAYTYLTNGIWHYQYAVKVSDDFDPSSVQGQWLDLKDDYTYIKGNFEDTTEVGEYRYNHEQKKIQFTPSNASYPDSEWTLNYRLGVLIMAGTPTYGNNDTQIKLVRNKNKPLR